ncbi:RmlC-like cupin domain-containing protein [Pseudomassariella vexata]|uniref:RmlC-like cupin domain-containing protein n=1 Tax=Pseudomassariella vexata TaxID=1141098 RepID=A0A1Y2EDE7_9PEZI|nr:RmlC-like cupin domain-containing protein [Pseudomassariella vexata]ORY68835.1 RmlC-like cupin domain-containing protein [Pseudomassariella vexata]
MATTAIKSFFSASFPPPPESSSTSALIKTLSMIPHIEGGYFTETDRDPLLISSPFPLNPASELMPQREGFDPRYRNASTSIYYLLTPSSPQGNFHRNRGRTVHTLHRGRGIYVLIHADEEDVEYEGGGRGKRVESFVVGHDVAKGERLQWIVEGGKYKASFLLPDQGAEGQQSGVLLISETVVPGFEYCDHDFLVAEGLKVLVGSEQAEKLGWLVRKS